MLYEVITQVVDPTHRFEQTYGHLLLVHVTDGAVDDIQVVAGQRAGRTHRLYDVGRQAGCLVSRSYNFV